ncbi:MAG: Ig-like domain-containing protein, partial [Candidatus Peribacteraceae bacterium]|nr:Ig-like domain-containing protein [Candidatus Peribacteraceae bacterium]
MKKRTALTLFVTFCGFVPLIALGADGANGMQTVAGLGAEITCQGFAQNEEISVRVLPPLGAPLVLTATADEQGRAVLHVGGGETELAGSYAVETDGTGSCDAFTVFPESLDQRESSIETGRTSVAADGIDEARITVMLRDRYLNPLENRPVQLLSGRTEDQIRPLAAQTDSEGQQSFAFSTLKPGTASLRAIDLLSGKALDASVAISVGEEWGRGGNSDSSFTANPNGWDTWNQSATVPVGEYQGRILYGQLTNTFDVVDHFRVEIEGGKTSVSIREDVTFRVVAEDRSGRTVEDYAGTIRFSSTDAKAILPFGTRQFALKDLGAKTFTLGLR